MIMHDNPSLTLKIGSHTDSRSPGKYNMWLSEKRMQRTIAYLVGQKGIDGARLVGEAFGETQLINECNDHTHCTEQRHKLNRKPEFMVLSW